jgi:hypothetical protein
MQVDYKELSSTRRFGVELEVSNDLSKNTIGRLVTEFESKTRGRSVIVTPGDKGWAESNGNRYWHVKYDSTCGDVGKYIDHGWEIASFVAAGENDLKHICDLVGFLQEKGVRTTKNCGLHVHVNAKDLTVSQVGLMLARWIKVEKFLYQICNPARTGNDYCRSLNMRSRNGHVYHPRKLSNFFYSMMPSNFNIHNNPEKKYSLNTFGYTVSRSRDWYRKPTVELRLPECVLDTEHVENWSRMFINFVDWCSCNSNPPTDLSPVTTIQELLFCLGLHGQEDFLIFDNHLFKTKKWLLQKLQIKAETMSIQSSEWLAFISQI